MKRVSIVVNNYMQMQGINSVVDQFMYNKKMYEEKDTKILAVYDSKKIHKEIPEREVNKRKKNRFLIDNIKSLNIYHSFFFQTLLIYLRFVRVGKKACDIVYHNFLNEDILVFQDVFAGYFFLKKNKLCKLVYMTHMYQDEIEQLLFNFPKISGSFVEKKLRKIYKYVYENSDGVITICNTAQKHILDNNLCKSIKVIYNGVSSINQMASPGSHSKIRFVMASSITKRKGMDIFLAAIEELDFEIMQQCEFHIFGEGDYFSSLENACKKYNNIFFYGKTKKPYQYYKDKDIYLMTSRYETLPMGIIEAMSCGMPILSTKVGAIDELVINNINGYLINVDSTSIINGIKQVVENKDKLAEMGQNSYKLFYDNFSSKKWTEKFAEFFEMLGNEC